MIRLWRPPDCASFFRVLPGRIARMRRFSLCGLTHGLHPKGRQNWRLAYLKNTAGLLLVQGNEQPTGLSAVI